MNATSKRILRIILILVPAILIGSWCACAWWSSIPAGSADFLRGQIMEQVAKATGARVEIGSVTPHWSHLSIDLNDTVVHGTAKFPGERAPEAALLQVEAPGSCRAVCSAHSWEAGTAHHDPGSTRRARANRFAGAQQFAGAAHTQHAARSRTRFSIWRFRTALSIRAQIFYNDAEIPLDAELHDLKFEAGYWRFDWTVQRFALLRPGTIGNRTDCGRSSTPAQLEFTASRTSLDIATLNLTSGASTLSLNAKMTDYGDPVVTGSYQGRLFTRELAEILEDRCASVGEVVAQRTNWLSRRRAAHSNRFWRGYAPKVRCAATNCWCARTRGPSKRVPLALITT